MTSNDRNWHVRKTFFVLSAHSEMICDPQNDRVAITGMCRALQMSSEIRLARQVGEEW